MHGIKDWKLEEVLKFQVIDDTTSWKIDACFSSNTGPLPTFDRNYWLTVGVVYKKRCKSAESALKHFKNLKQKKVDNYETGYEE